MELSKTIKTALASGVGAMVVSSTLLFPVIKDINNTLSEEKVESTSKEADVSKSEQVITKEQNSLANFPTSTSSQEENPSIPATVSSTNDPKMYSSDTIESNLLMEDIPHYKRN
jgi:hypothetical protein